MASCIGTNVDEVVGSTHNLFVVLHDNHRVAQCLQFLEYLDQAVSVAGMQSDAWLIKDVERPYE